METGDSGGQSAIQSIDLGDVPFVQVADGCSVGESKEGLVCIWTSPGEEIEVHETGPSVVDGDSLAGNKSASSADFMITNVKQEAVEEFAAGDVRSIPQSALSAAQHPNMSQPANQSCENPGFQELLTLPEGGRIVLTKDGQVEFQVAGQHSEPKAKEKIPPVKDIKRNLDVCNPVSNYWAKKMKTDTDFLNAPVPGDLKPIKAEGGKPNTDAQKEYECTICGKIFKDEPSIRLHLHKKHEIAKFVCCFCGFTANTEAGMDTHVDNKHPASVWKCQWYGCGYWSVNQSSVSGHYTSNHKSYLVEQSERVKPGSSRDKYRDLQAKKWNRINLASLPD